MPKWRGAVTDGEVVRDRSSQGTTANSEVIRVRIMVHYRLVPIKSRSIVSRLSIRWNEDGFFLLLFIQNYKFSRSYVLAIRCWRASILCSLLEACMKRSWSVSDLPSSRRSRLRRICTCLLITCAIFFCCATMNVLSNYWCFKLRVACSDYRSFMNSEVLVSWYICEWFYRSIIDRVWTIYSSLT